MLVQEICDYGSYPDADFTGVTFGFGTSPDHVPMLFLPGVLASIWGGPVRLLADELGVVVDEMRERHETWVTEHPIDCAMMRVERGQVAAVRFAVEGMVGGRPAMPSMRSARSARRYPVSCPSATFRCPRCTACSADSVVRRRSGRGPLIRA